MFVCMISKHLFCAPLVQAEAPDVKQDVSNHRNISIVGTSSVGSCYGDSFSCAGFLPLPAGVRQLSARACPCVVRLEKKLLLACQIQVRMFVW